MKKELAPVNDFSKKAKEMTGSLPCQYDNKDYGKKRKAKAHKFSVRDTKTGKLYWSPAIHETETLTFSKYLLTEDKNSAIIDKITSLPDSVVGELKKLINKGARDLSQNWQHAGELVNTAYHVANIRRPVPDQRGAWKQYTELLRHGVQQLWKTRGNKGDWRASNIVYAESVDHGLQILTEKPTRYFVMIPNTADVEINTEEHPEIKTIGDVVQMLTNKLRRQGAKLRVDHMMDAGAVCTVFIGDEPREEIVIKAV